MFQIDVVNKFRSKQRPLETFFSGRAYSTYLLAQLIFSAILATSIHIGCNHSLA